MTRSVVVTGVGVCAANGTGVPSFWDALIPGSPEPLTTRRVRIPSAGSFEKDRFGPTQLAATP